MSWRPISARRGPRRSGALIELLRTARSLCIGRGGAGVAAIDSASPAGTDHPTFHDETITARRCGFAGKFTMQADQVALLNEVFTGLRPTLAAKP
jgi:citrate lyase beta subunit